MLSIFCSLAKVFNDTLQFYSVPNPSMLVASLIICGSVITSGDEDKTCNEWQLMVHVSFDLSKENWNLYVLRLKYFFET